MPKPMTITASTKLNGTKVDAEPRTVEFSRFVELDFNGPAPKPWESWQEFFLDAVAHKVVKIQQEMREELTSGSGVSNTKRNTLLD